MKKLIFSVFFSVFLCCKSVFVEGEIFLIVNDLEIYVS